MGELLEVLDHTHILPEYQGTPIGLLFEYHNLGRPLEKHDYAKLLIGMCMDSRKTIVKPPNFAFILRTGGGNLRNSEFKVSFAIAVAGIQHIALVAHNHCRMVNLHLRKQDFIDGLIKRAGWTHEDAEQHFNEFAPQFEIGNEIDFVVSEARRLKSKYPKVMVAPMLYNVDDNKLYQIIEK